MQVLWMLLQSLWVGICIALLCLQSVFPWIRPQHWREEGLIKKARLGVSAPKSPVLQMCPVEGFCVSYRLRQDEASLARVEWCTDLQLWNLCGFMLYCIPHIFAKERLSQLHNFFSGISFLLRYVTLVKHVRSNSSYPSMGNSKMLTLRQNLLPMAKHL